ncbi:SAM-dependent methyltransferase [Streptomyces sp. HNM0575]|uniref:SAM-dependent methyltransferase n=1 Tax=Streptomyces sp. HNM0575 TaxID=2716338 RepID=UPI00145EE2FD|nr:SAM-dependent methyltransferase [Streptomyces sp. HNM0575]NLU74648.1 SAM-dependent methyltransferase [Streptomyces sp. HNM0575]
MTDSSEVDTSRPHAARIYDYILGGKDWFPVDKEAGEQVTRIFPHIATQARANRDYMHRAVRLVAREFGVRQFLDIGTGIPTAPNLHQVAQEVAPDSSVVYADHDPLVLEYADALMHSTPEGSTAYVQADVRRDSVLDSREVRETLDLDRPVALSLLALLHFVPDEHGPQELVRSMLRRLAPGSFLLLSHATADFDEEGQLEGVKKVYDQSGTPVQLRGEAEVRVFFDGLEMIEPGLVPVHRWRPDGPTTISDAESCVYAGVARKA